MKPIKNFVIAGAQRSGSTFLYNLLLLHKDIEGANPSKPEPKFFLKENEYDQGKEYYLKKYFASVEGQNSIKYIGEKSTSYLEFNHVPNRIYKFFPDARVFIVLRNPIDRAISNYFFSKNNQLETRDIKCALYNLKPEPKLKINVSASPFDYLKRGLYTNYLMPYLSVFGSNLKIILFEELINSCTMQKSVFQFLGLEAPNNLSYESIPKNKSKYEPNLTNDLSELRIELYEYYQREVVKLSELLSINLDIWKVK